MPTLIRFTLVALLSIIVSAASSTTAADAPRRNVLFLIADDLNNLIGCYGDRLAKTPNIDRLAARGTRFDRAYCSFPLCGPSRNSFLTGLYPNCTGIHTNGVVFRQTIPSQHSMPQAFRLSGYFAGRVGKLYHYNVPRSIGTNGHDDPGSWELELNPAGVDRLVEEPDIITLVPGQFGGTLSWYASPRPDDEHTDALNAEDAIWVLERCAQRRERPFFLAVGFFRPHTPYVSPQAYFDMHPKSDMPLVTGVAEDRADIPPAGLASAKPEQAKLTDDQRLEVRQAYNASISFMDAQVGRVVDALDRLGLADNTIIVFTSDHGYHMGEHGLWQKMSLFEESSRVPLLIVAPGVSGKGSVVATPVSQIDLFPTLARLCDVETPDNLPGQDLAPMLREPETVGRGWALTQVTRGGRRGRRQGNNQPGFFGYSLRTPRWRYTEWDEGREGRELYDHDADPRELKNLADDPALASTISELSTKLREAIQSSLPPSGEIPGLRPGTWAPDLTDP
ncbi:MAG: sulfatase [Pirellulales bacterium]